MLPALPRPAMIDAKVNCPTVQAWGFGTSGQQAPAGDSTRDSSGTSTLKCLAAAVLARDGRGDANRDSPNSAVPAFPTRTPPVGTLPPPPVPAPAQPYLGVPLAWCDGVALLATMPAPPAIPPPRWAVLTRTAARLLRDHGAELHAPGWDVLDLFGLHAAAPAANPAGWGLAWLLGEHGDVLDVSPDAVGMRRGPDGARLAYRRRGAMARAGVVPAWRLGEMAA